jgi:hypothetical protein
MVRDKKKADYQSNSNNIMDVIQELCQASVNLRCFFLGNHQRIQAGG